ncbi:MAG TPA: adenylosuccinate synthetase [Pseudonocardia sp.]|uniref:adenylosuccinate synthetase n=1 Tax=Pseudonocardia sp. TaxID=60912 RepID=UPI002C5315F6|nr:adenylosuccinate synthetase [Pseudonocardia sp.]HTF47537.1 adenylosuccinate synthetase [Pseudonocardia sp.]
MTGDVHDVVVGLGFGDEGKGAVVDALCGAGHVAAVVRFNGGAQAAHTVVDGDRAHTFHQFGSGTLQGVRTFLSRHVAVEPLALATESRALEHLGVADPLRLVSVATDAPLTTPIHVAANRTREDARGAARHGSCGLGVGETVWYGLVAAFRPAPGSLFEGHPVASSEPPPAPTVGDCREPARLRRTLDALARWYAPLLAGGAHGFGSVGELVAVYREFGAAVRIVGDGELGTLAARGPLVFEGAQGALLDQHHGFHPYTTWSNTTPANARGLLAEIGGRARVLGVTRTSTTRHGAGPLPTEDPTLRARLPEPHNGDGGYQGAWRVGHLDAVLLRHAVRACGGIDGLAVTHLDRASSGLHWADRYADGTVDLPEGRPGDLAHQSSLTARLAVARPVLDDLPRDADALLAQLERTTGVPVVVTGHGPDRTAHAVRRPVLR